MTVHEATHNWCFLTPVGSAAAALTLRARRRAAALAAAGAASDDAIWEVLDDHLRATYVLRALHPLSEGLALFAEHEVVPEHSSHLSAVMQSALAYFQREAVGSEGVAGAVNRLLVSARCSVDGVRRKATLLEQPLWTGGIRGGYLAGYLTIKNLWLVTCRSCERFADSDLFLQYLRAWFFGDWGLVAHVLDDETEDIVATGRIVEHIAGRLNALASADHQDAADRLEERGRWAPPTGSERWAIGVQPGVEDAARRRLSAIVTEVIQPSEDTDLMRAAARVAREVFDRRPLMLLGRLPVDVLVDGGDVMVLGPERPLVFLPQKRHGLKPQDGHGTGELEVFAAPVSDLKPTVFCVWRDGQLVAMDVSHGDLAAAGASHPVMSVQGVEDAGATLQRVLYMVLEAGDSHLDVARVALDGLERYQFEAFSRSALHLADADRVERLRELMLMHEYGFLPIVGGADGVWALAFLSVLTKLPVPRELLGELYVSLGGPPGRLEDAFDAVQSATSDAFGVPLVSGNPDRFFAYL